MGVIYYTPTQKAAANSLAGLPWLPSTGDELDYNSSLRTKVGASADLWNDRTFVGFDVVVYHSRPACTIRRRARVDV